MISRRLFTAGCLLTPLVGCQKPPRSSTPKWNKVNGFASVNDRRVELIDGFVDYAYEPLEWKRYSLCLNFWHDALTKIERALVYGGAWVDPNHKTVPDGFPMAPMVSVSIGQWRFGEPPGVTEHTHASIYFRGFLGNKPSGRAHGFGVPRHFVQLTERKPAFGLKWESNGEHQYDGARFAWDLSFSGFCYDSAWILGLNRDGSPIDEAATP